MNILVGTASWTDKTLIACGRFYPLEVTSAEARLRYYATQFPIVEIDSSFYGMPSERNARLWAQRTPDDFVFNVKAFRLFTGHQTAPSDLPQDIRAELRDAAPPNKPLYYRDLPPALIEEMWCRYIDALRPLKEAGKLGAVHFQFAPWLPKSAAAMRHVEQCVEHMQGYHVAAEFRNRTWFEGDNTESTLAFERGLGLVNVVVDEPQGEFANCIPSVWSATSEKLAIVRLHGRNVDAWHRTNAASAHRFNYDYSEAELAELSQHVKRLAQQVESLHVIVNVNYEDKGQNAARDLNRLLNHS